MSSTGRQLGRVTLTYEPHEGSARDLDFDDFTPDDLTFTLSALYARKRRAATGSPAVLNALDTARKDQMQWYAARQLEALQEGLGWWRHLLPRRVRARIAALQTDYLYDVTAQWSLELGDLHAQVSQLDTNIRALRDDVRKPKRPAAATGERCGGLGCTLAAPSGRALPAGWMRHEGLLLCPDHPAPAASTTKKAS